jgi:hypothetical protein
VCERDHVDRPELCPPCRDRAAWRTYSDSRRNGTVLAITSDGTTAWTADLGLAIAKLGASGVDYSSPQNVVPDFQSGMVLMSDTQMWKLDGATGQPYPAYTATGYLGEVPLVVHPDGTIFALDGTSIVGIDLTTGAAKFSAAIPIDFQVAYSMIVAGDGYACLPSRPRPRSTRS